MYKLAVLDIDGTLVDKNGKISRKNIEAIRKVYKSGKIVTLCTGRNIYKTIPVIKSAGINVPVVCMDGTILYDNSNKKILYDLEMKKNEVSPILEIASKYKTLIEVSDGYKYYKCARPKDMLKYDIFNKHTFLGRIQSYLGGIRYTNKLEYFNELNKYYQIVVAGEQDTVDDIKNKINSIGLERVEIRDYLWDNYIFINRKGIKKSHGLELLCNHFNVAMDEIVAMGDESNDIDMLKTAGVGVAMENGSERVKEAADFITKSNCDDGVAFALEKFFL